MYVGNAITCQNSPFSMGGGNCCNLPLGAAASASVKNICFIHKLVRWLESSRRTGFCFAGGRHYCQGDKNFALIKGPKRMNYGKCKN